MKKEASEIIYFGCLGKNAVLVCQNVVLALDGAKPRDILLAHECASEAIVPCAAGAANAVDIILGFIRHVVVDDQIDVVHIDAARGNVGRNQHRRFPCAEVAHDDVALVLAQVAM